MNEDKLFIVTTVYWLFFYQKLKKYYILPLLSCLITKTSVQNNFHSRVILKHLFKLDFQKLREKVLASFSGCLVLNNLKKRMFFRC